MLVGFRSFMHFHFHAMKVSMHTRMRKKVAQFQLTIENAKRDTTESVKWKDTHSGENKNKPVGKDQKVEEVLKFA